MNQTPEEYVDSLPGPDSSALDILNKWSANGESGNMKQKMLDDVFIMKDIAILGQWTVLYAAPNTGKTLLTLWLLREAIQEHQIEPNDVYYANCDDTMKGGQEKLEHIAEKHGFNMLIPGINGFEPGHLVGVMLGLVDAQQARGKVIVMDTLKKFTDLMDKKLSSQFGSHAREFINAGGSLICLAHTNKKKGEDGKSIQAGTSDIVDDADCAYIVENLRDQSNPDGSNTTTIQFENRKQRGDVSKEVTFKYSKKPGDRYLNIFDSVTRVTYEESMAAKQTKIIAEAHDRDSDIIDAVLEAIHCSSLSKTELVDKVYEETGRTKGKIRQTLKRWEGKDYSKGHRWFISKQDKNKQIYHRTVQRVWGG